MLVSVDEENMLGSMIAQGWQISCEAKTHEQVALSEVRRLGKVHLHWLLISHMKLAVKFSGPFFQNASQLWLFCLIAAAPVWAVTRSAWTITEFLNSPLLCPDEAPDSLIRSFACVVWL